MFASRLDRLKLEHTALTARLEAVNPENVLKRGYSYVESDSGDAIDSVSKIKIGQEVKIVFADGSAKSTIIEINRKE